MAVRLLAKIQLNISLDLMYSQVSIKQASSFNRDGLPESILNSLVARLISLLDIKI